SVTAAVLAVQNGAHVVRVHDVKETVQALKVLAAMKLQQR
ncbi:MAG TPA: dihydropteroate synthase, partial [Rhodoferax sp.]|nr:dihydropteroate synthase [Rhodoferax sp.]